MAETRENKRTLVSRPFSKEEMSTSSTRRELQALADFFVTQREIAAELYKGRELRHFTDNMAVSIILRTGSKKQHLQKVARNILLANRESGIKLVCSWVSREHELLQQMDEGSRGPWAMDSEFVMDYDTAELVLNVIRPDVDCFATARNSLVHRYFALGRDETAEGKDFFLQQLNRDTRYWCHPHPRQTVDVWKHLWFFGAWSGFLLHVWESAPWFPQIVKRNHLPRVVKEIRRPAPSFTHTEWCEDQCFEGQARYPVLLLILDFGNSSSWESAMQRNGRKGRLPDWRLFELRGDLSPI